MPTLSRADIVELYQEQQKLAEAYVKHLAQALTDAEEEAEANLDTQLEADAKRALELLQQQQERWQRCISTQVRSV